MILFYDRNISYKRDKYDNKEFGDIDISIVTTHMMLEVQNLGLGTTWIGSFDPQKLVEIFNKLLFFKIYKFLLYLYFFYL